MRKELIILIIALLILPIADAAFVEDKVLEELDANEQVKVIIKLKDDTESFKAVDVPKQREARKEFLQQKLEAKKEKIASKQDKVLSRLESKKVLKAKGRVGTLAKENEFFELKHKYSTISGFSGKITKQALEELRNDPDVESIVINKPVSTFLDVSIPLIQADDIWNLVLNGANITGQGETVCIIDTGVDYTHANLGGCFGAGCKVVGGYDYCSDGVTCTSEDSDPMDVYGHGTHVAGIVSSSHTTYKGVAPDAKIVAVKVLNDTGTGWNSEIILGIEWCVNNATKFNISVISMSLGGGGPYDNYCNNDSLAPAINSATSQGIAVVVASGNSGWTNGISSPACVQNAIPIGAVNDADSIFYNRGSLLRLLAPGISISSTLRGGGFGDMSGTSMSTPHAAGAVALVQQFMRLWNGTTMTPAEIENKLNATGKQIYDAGSSRNYSRIDIFSAIISYDAEYPTLNFVDPTPNNDHSTKNTTLLINITASDDLQLDFCLLEWNYTNESMTKVESGRNISCYMNKSIMGSGKFDYRVYIIDYSNKINSTELRNITILNTPPNITSITLVSTDDLNRTNGTLNANWNFHDVNNDSIIYNETRWYKDNAEIISLKNLTIINQENTTRDDIWIFSLRMFDGYNWSNWVNSSPLTIKNDPPILATIKNLTTVNESLLVNITVNASDIDNDLFNYSINDTRFIQKNNSFTWQTNLTDNGIYSVRINVTDNSDSDYLDFIINILDAPDFDNDGNPDFNDTDDDDDSINDPVDTLKGDLTYITSDISLKLKINNSENTTQIFNTTLPVNITYNNNSLIEFNWNFTASTLVVNWTIDYNATAGTIRIKDIDLTSQGITKTVYINKSSSSYNYVCIADDETTSVSSLPSDCSGYTKISCSSSGQCIDLGSMFKVSGLSHSAVRGISYTPPSSPPAGSSGGGGGGACTSIWQCITWSECINDIQNRTCTDLKNCKPASTLKPDEIQSCGCMEYWRCDGWLPEECPQSKEQTRKCLDWNGCGTEESKPQTKQECEYKETCDDGIKNQDEEDIDCGGSCEPCIEFEKLASEKKSNFGKIIFITIISLMLVSYLTIVIRKKLMKNI